MLKCSNMFYLIAVVVTLLSVPESYAGIITFEDMPEEYWYHAGSQNTAIYWEGVTFGPEATILESEVYYYSNDLYPQHSGTSVMYSNDVPYIDAELDDAANEVSLWYTCNTTFYLDAYDESDNIIATITGPENLGTTSFLSVSVDENIIHRVRMYNEEGMYHYFTIDDFETEAISGNPRPPVPVPEPSIVLLIFCGIPGIALFRKRN